MKLHTKISWIVSRVQKSLFSHLNKCFASALTEQEKRLVIHKPTWATKYLTVWPMWAILFAGGDDND